MSFRSAKPTRSKAWRKASPRSGFLERGEGAPRLSSTHRGKKAPLKSFSSYCTTRIRCSGVADGTAGPDRAGENSPRTLRAEGEGGRKGDRSLERRGRGMGRARQEDAGERERERDQGRGRGRGKRDQER